MAVENMKKLLVWKCTTSDVPYREESLHEKSEYVFTLFGSSGTVRKGGHTALNRELSLGKPAFPLPGGVADILQEKCLFTQKYRSKEK